MSGRFGPAAAHLRQHKGKVQGLRPEGAKELNPGFQPRVSTRFQPWVTATQKCALKCREDEETRANDFDPIWRAGIWCPFSTSNPEDRVFFTRGATA